MNMKTIYATEVTGIGSLADSFRSERMIILFKDNAPEELADYCVLHSGNLVYGQLQAGDLLSIGSRQYPVIHVGDEVQLNLEQLGHITLRFSGETDGLGGSVYLAAAEAPEISVGDEITFYRA